MNQLVKAIGVWWLRRKWGLSEALAGIAWRVPVAVALGAYGAGFEWSKDAQDLDDVVDVFRGRWRWKSDPFFQVWDRVFPPMLLLGRGGDDCDGWAMAHAQAVTIALGRLGWSGRIASYLASRWWLSHHFAVALDPLGRVWAIQPQASADQDPNLQLVHGPFPSIREAADTVASWYGVTVEYLDVRLDDGRLERAR